MAGEEGEQLVQLLFDAWHRTDPQPVDCACGMPMEPLLTIDSTEWHGGGRSWMPLEDRAREGATALPTGVTIGRWGALRIFTCPADPTHPRQVGEQ
ncbi:hypothetical protein OG455_30930 [Kitasatospora sp. NBC_01287]|uniref:hypothetical protein n=1 Tax=Kitasatospora sp. NBC_01287 TaxID=2903573 RepID=UPI002254BBA5|nr:hypothetical protein [Kitasatospora sp. NBC_01287]MCX4749879.1 hypothetical protein [Kitasatospora sp. NBC_01287]